MSNMVTTAGIDCGKRFLDVAVVFSSDKIRVTNTPDGHQDLVAWLARRGVAFVGLEASGGYERSVRDALRAAGLRIPIYPARDSDLDPATCSDLIPATCTDRKSARWVTSLQQVTCFIP